jgi:hypothetical protein
VRVVVLAALLAAAGCGGSGSSSPTDVMSATFSSLAGPNSGGLTCTASEAANGAGRARRDDVV